MITINGLLAKQKHLEREIASVQRYSILMLALLEIKRVGGKVCANYELCSHVSCESSVAAWMIATKALSSLVESLDTPTNDRGTATPEQVDGQ